MLVIQDNAALLDLSGLAPDLTVDWGVEVVANPALTSLVGLEAATVDGVVHVKDNTAL